MTCEAFRESWLSRRSKIGPSGFLGMTMPSLTVGLLHLDVPLCSSPTVREGIHLPIAFEAFSSMVFQPPAERISRSTSHPMSATTGNRQLSIANPM